MKEYVIVDTCFWIALLDPEDPIQHEKANEIVELIENQNLVIPFPTLYEFINSRLSRRDQRVKFEDILKKPNVYRVSDEKYKDQAIENFFRNSQYYLEDQSLVDEIIKLMLRDSSMNIGYIVTFDGGLENYALSLGKKNLNT